VGQAVAPRLTEREGIVAGTVHYPEGRCIGLGVLAVQMGLEGRCQDLKPLGRTICLHPDEGGLVDRLDRPLTVLGSSGQELLHRPVLDLLGGEPLVERGIPLAHRAEKVIGQEPEHDVEGDPGEGQSFGPRHGALAFAFTIAR